MAWVGISDKLVAWGRQLILHLLQVLDEFVDRIEAIADVRVGTVLDQLIEGFRRSVQRRADTKASMSTELFRQCKRAFCRRLACEELVTNSAK